MELIAVVIFRRQVERFGKVKVKGEGDGPLPLFQKKDFRGKCKPQGGGRPVIIAESVPDRMLVLELCSKAISGICHLSIAH